MEGERWPTFPGDPTGRARKSRRSDADKRSLRRRKSRNRHADRRNKLGREMEGRVNDIGQNMVEGGELEEFIYHEPNSPEDQEGRDFTAVMVIDGERVDRSFGITISGNGVAALDRVLHPKAAQWSLPWNTKDETIRGKILRLFDPAPV